MQAVLLAAGKSSRFYPYNQHLEHKSLVVVMGKTLLEHTLDNLKKSSIDKVIIVVGKNSTIPQLLSNWKDIAITFVVQPEPLGMGDALLHAKKHLEKKFFVLGSYHVDILDFAKEMSALQSKENAVVLVKKDDILDRYGNVTLEKERVIDIVEKPDKAQRTMHRIAAIYLLPKQFIRVLEETPQEEYQFEKALRVFSKNNYVQALVTQKPTVTLKYSWDILGIKDHLLSRVSTSVISKKASVAKDALLIGTVVIEDGATVLEGAIIKGPAYIGKKVLIGNRAILRGGVSIEEQSVVGSQMEVKNTLIMEHTTTHAGFIGDSIIGHDTKIAGGIVTANVRLDRQPVTSMVQGEKVNTGLRHFGTIIGNTSNIGIRVAIMPGVIIGNNVIVGPSTTVMKNIDDDKKYYTKFVETVEENHLIAYDKNNGK